MPHWFVLTLLLLFRSCEGFHFNVTRVIHGDRRDLFTNMDPLGKCPRRNDNGRQWCLDRNGDCSNLGCCICSCTYSHSTFRMGTSPKTATCVENSSFRTFASKGFRNILLSTVLALFVLLKNPVCLCIEKCLIALRKRCDGGKRILYLCKRGFKNFTLREGVFVAVGKNEKLFSEAIFNFFFKTTSTCILFTFHNPPNKRISSSFTVYSSWSNRRLLRNVNIHFLASGQHSSRKSSRIA